MKDKYIGGNITYLDGDFIKIGINNENGVKINMVKNFLNKSS